MENKKLIFDAISMLANCYSGTVSDARIQAYCEVLGGIELREIHQALRKCMVAYKYFPTLAEIFAMMKPQEDKKDLANEMVANIFQAMREFGTYQWEQAKAALGPQAWFAVESFGGWREIGEVKTDQLQTARAQLRDMCAMAMTVANREERPNLLPFQRTSMKRLGGMLEETNYLTDK